MKRIAIAFVDDTSFYSNEDNLQKKITIMIQYYARLYEVMEGLIELNKSYYYAWQWKHVNGIDKLVNIEIKIKTKQENIKQIKILETI